MDYEEDQQADPEQKKLRKAIMQQYKAAQIEQQKKEAMQRLLAPKAYERLMNIRAANPELYSQLVNLIISLAQGSRINGKITEEQLIMILQKVTARPESRIEFKHK